MTQHQNTAVRQLVRAVIQNLIPGGTLASMDVEVVETDGQGRHTWNGSAMSLADRIAAAFPARRSDTDAARDVEAIVREQGALPVPAGDGSALLSTRTRELVEMEADRNRWKTEAERLKTWSDSREARELELLATMGQIDLREAPEAWALGMTVLSHLDGPSATSTPEERESGLLALIEQLRARVAELEATVPTDRLTRTFAATQVLREEADES